LYSNYNGHNRSYNKVILAILLSSILVLSLFSITTRVDTNRNNEQSFVIPSPVYAQNVQNSNNASTSNNASRPFIGVNMRGYYTSSILENRPFGNTSFPANYYEDSFRAISQAGMNFVRYLLYWESYEKNPSQFMSELNIVAKTADKYKIKVLYDNDQYHTSSWLEPDRGYGLPSSLFEDNPSYDFGGGGGFESDQPTGENWWTDWWNRSVEDTNGTDGWTLQANFLKRIVNAVDKNPSTLGYEILNEPHVYKQDQWEKIGKFNTFITDELRKVTEKILVFDRQVPPDIYGPIENTPENMAKMAPSNKTNVAFKATLFGLPFQGEEPEERLTTYVKTAQIAGVPLCICEFNLRLSDRYHPVSDLNQTLLNLFIQKFQEVKVWGWAFWIWDFKAHTEQPNYDLIRFNGNQMQTTKYYNYLKNSILNVATAAKNTSKNSSISQSSISATTPIQEIIQDTIFPTIAITNIKIQKDEQTNNNNILQVEGQGIDVGSGIKTVEIRVDDGTYIPAKPKVDGDWLNWAASIPVKSSNANHKVIAKAIDNTNYTGYVTVNLKKT
jgi:hypothetical protein